MQLTAIPGVGEKTAKALETLDDPSAAVKSGDVAAIAQAPGITPGRAARIARAAIRARHGDEGEFLATDRAQALYRDVLELLQERAETTFGKRRLETLYPTSASSRIEEVRSLATHAMERTPDPSIRDPLGRVRPLSTPRNLRIRDRCLATGDAERYEAASRAFPELSVEIVDDTRALADLASGYTTVIVLDEAFAGLDTDNNVLVQPSALEHPVEVVPERTLTFVSHNRKSILAAIEVHRLAELDAPVDLVHLEALLDTLDEDGTPIGDDETNRLRAAIDDLDVSVDLARTVADDALREAIRERDVTVDGTDLLSMVEQGAGVDALLTRELRDEYADAIDRAITHLVDALSLTEAEASDVERLFPDEPTFPVPTNDELVEQLRTDLRDAYQRRTASRRQTLASDLEAIRDGIDMLVSRALELDVELAIARFVADFQCTLPTFDGDGIELVGGRSPLINLPYDAVEPVDYDVNEVVLLSGVNSGGKTSLLDLVATCVILAHMGLPVPAENLRLQRFDSLHYHAATQGTLDSGAFEATVRQFAALATGQGDRLVLVDELESITEPGAAAIIIGGILEELSGDVTAVFVSHLASEIRDVTAVDIRVDGIAASGVEDGELVVNRTPIRNHLARSTPELIVEQLATTEDGPQTAIYERLLDKF